MLLLLKVAFLSVFLGFLVLGISTMLTDSRQYQHRVINQQQITDSHELRNWRLK